MRKSILFLVCSLLFTSFMALSAEKPIPHSDMADHANMAHAQPEASPADARPLYSGQGIIKAWSNGTVVIRHQAIPKLHWPAMTMSFRLADYQGAPLEPGQQVDFTFRQIEAGYALVSASVKE